MGGPYQRLGPVEHGQHALPAQPQRVHPCRFDHVLRLARFTDADQGLCEVAVPAAARRVVDAEALLQLPHPAQRTDRARRVPGHQLGVAQRRQRPGQVHLVAVDLGVVGRLTGEGHRLVDIPGRGLREGGEHGRGALTDAGVPGEPQALTGQVEGPAAVPGAQLRLGEEAQEVHLALDHAAPPHLAQQRGDGGPCLGQLVAHDEPAEPGRAGTVVVAGHIGVLGFPQRPFDRGGGVRVAHQGLGGGLEGQRHQLGAAVPAPGGQLRRVRGLLPGLGEVALDDQSPPGQLVVDQGEQAGVVPRVGQHLREHGVDLAERLPGGLDDHHPGAYPLRGHGGTRQYVAGDVPGEIGLAGGDRVLGGLQTALVRAGRTVRGGVPGREQPERGGHGRCPAVPGQRAGVGEPGRHLRVGAGGRQGQVPGPLDRVGGRGGQRGVHGPPFPRRGLRVQSGRDQRVREPYGGALRLRRQQPERRRLGGLGLCLFPAGRVQQRQRGAGTGAGHEEGAARLVRQHLQPVQHQGPQ